jgi:hypothetical protein
MGLTGNGLDVGSVFARAGLLFDDDGFDKWRKAIREAREEAGKDVKPNLEADFNSRGFDQFGKALKDTRLDATKDVKPDLGADFNDRGFDLFGRALRSARSEHDVTTDLKADVDETGFRKYDRALRSARNESDITTRAGVRTGAGFIGIGKSAGAAALGFIGTYGLVEGVRHLFTAYRESEKVGKQTEAVIKSTGGEAQVTAGHVGMLADKFSHMAAVDDEAVQSGENLLLTFTNIRNEVGRGNNIFDQASLTILNMSTALDQDLKSSAIQLGKALNDPIKGITALSRVGVSFTESTKERITTLTEDGKVMAAQKIILKELNKEFGGSAKAAGAGASGFDRLGVAAENLEEKLGAKLAPALSTGANAVADFFDSLSGSGKGGKGNKAGAAIRRILGEVGGALSGFKNEVSDLWHTATRLFSGIGDAFDETFGGKSEIGDDLAKIGKALRGFGEAALRVYNAVVKRALPGIVTAFRGAFQVIRGITRVLAGILTLDFGKAWEGVKDIFSGGVKLIGGTLRAATAPMRAAVAAIGGVISHGFSAAWGFVEKTFNKGLDSVLGLLSSFLGTLGDVSGFVSGIRESLRKTDDEQGNAVKASKRQVDALKAERAQLRLNNASHDQLKRNKQALRRAQDDLSDATKKTGQSMQKSTGNAKGWGSQLRTLTGRTREAKGGTDKLHGTLRDQGPSGVFAKGLKRLIRGSGNFQGALGRAVEFVKDATNKATARPSSTAIRFPTSSTRSARPSASTSASSSAGRSGARISRPGATPRAVRSAIRRR